MSFEAPPRLKHDAELGPILRAADTPVAGERIAANGEAVKAAIAAGLARASLPLWKIILPLVLAIVAGGVAVQRTRAVSVPIGHDVISHDPEPGIAVTERSVAHEPPPPSTPTPTPTPTPTLPHAVATLPEPPADVPAPSELPEQIALYEQAREAAGKGELARAIDLVDELLRRSLRPSSAPRPSSRAPSCSRAPTGSPMPRPRSRRSPRTPRTAVAAASCCARSATSAASRAIARPRSMPTPAHVRRV